MGAADRDYSRTETRRSAPTGTLTPVVKWLLIINIGVYLLDILWFQGRLRNLGAFTISSSILQGKIWQLITFQFLHGSVAHVLFNSIGIYFFGPWMERWWGARRFLVFYLLCGAAGALFYSLLTLLHVLPTDLFGGLVGASAGIYGILVGIAIIAPNLRAMLIFPPIELSIRQMALAVLLIAVVKIVFDLSNAGGEAGHLGGAILGFILVKYPILLGWAKKHEKEVEIIRPKRFSFRPEAKLKPRTSVNLERDSEVDRILDKISREGIHSITAEEREKLNRASIGKKSDS
ncbi:rhomboid family intramembrane serine protease [Luteolibacter pohnpeiensis]|uniref:Rhomboid family intramembrane serine protease n=1 Tax=Luteolibacter pohnpeiensis TaxID=454153 RepID=A0A934S5F0_9BACT|nr:rhomboid family intramembrane serine protease [Luteolibacter pohnpeiensis]MBK1882911.1 rhomboid family intramembrane serine protease [Luteolibacter pohnpeiensis]